MQRLIQLLVAVLAAVPAIASPVLAQAPQALQDRYQTIIDTYEAQLRQLDSGTPQGRRQVARILHQAGVAYRDLGRYDPATELLQRALALTRELENERLEASVLQDLAQTASRQGDVEGIAFLEQQLAAWKQDPRRREIILGVLAPAYYAASDLRRALTTYQAYIPLAEAHQRQSGYIDLARSVLSDIYLTIEDYDRAIATLQKTLTAARARDDSSTQVTTLLALASAYETMDKPAQALEAYQQAVQGAQSGNEVTLINAQWRLGRFLLSRGELGQAVPLLEQNLVLAERANQLPLNSLVDLSYAYLQQGNLPKAMELQQRALTLTQQLPAQVRDSSRSLKAELLKNAGFLLLQSGRLAEAEAHLRASIQSYADYQQWVLQHLNLFSASRDALSLGLRENFSEAYWLLQQVLVEQEQFQPALAIAEEGRARATVDLLLLNASEPAVTQPLAAPLSVEQIQQIARSQNITLVQYSILYNQPVGRGYLSNREQWETALLIWTIQPTGAITLRQVDLLAFWQQAESGRSNAPTNLHTLVQSSREDIGVRGRGLGVVGTTQQLPKTTALKQLHQILIQPIADLLPADPTARIVFIPQRELLLVPFAALQAESGDYLIDQHTVLTAPSIQILDLLSQRQARQTGTAAIAPAEALIVGNPTMPPFATKVGATPTPLPPLPGAEAEAKTIAQLLGTQPILGRQATEGAIAARMEQARLIHLATHGILDDFLGFQSAIALAPTAADDGLLTTLEIAKLNLQADLVVLSACDTGRGRLGGDGVIGLSRSFIGAGVPSIIASLWKVPDTPTAVLMMAFYRNLQQSSDKAQALRQAMLQTKQQYPNPRDWAAFTLIGAAE